jgi:hypothetical protein
MTLTCEILKTGWRCVDICWNAGPRRLLPKTFSFARRHYLNIYSCCVRNPAGRPAPKAATRGARRSCGTAGVWARAAVTPPEIRVQLSGTRPGASWWRATWLDRVQPGRSRLSRMSPVRREKTRRGKYRPPGRTTGGRQRAIGSQKPMDKAIGSLGADTDRPCGSRLHNNTG